MSMFKTILGFGEKYGGPVWDVGPEINDIPDSTWPEPTPENVHGIKSTIIDQLPEGVENPDRLSLRELAGLAIKPTYDNLPEATKALVNELAPDLFS